MEIKERRQSMSPTMFETDKAKKLQIEHLSDQNISIVPKKRQTVDWDKGLKRATATQRKKIDSD